MTDRWDQQSLAQMTATIYAARMTAYWSAALPKTKETWHKQRKAVIKASITDAVMICEMVARDFPTLTE
jgi:hypothetical protein